MTTPTISGVRGVRTEIMERVEQRLAEFLARERARWVLVDQRGAVLIDAIASLVAAGGKRLRPTFCVSGFLAAGGDPTDASIVDISAGLELIHVSALIHDDVLDDSSRRRGAPTVHALHSAGHAAGSWQGESRRYGEGVAILAGDLADVYADRLANALSPGARETWDRLRTEVIIGQFLDVDAAAQSVIDPEMSRWIAVFKSGRYSIHRPLALGAGIAGRYDLAAEFAEYGEALGEAFQLRDDLIDACGDAHAAGKPVGLDLEQHKMTLLLARAAERDDRIRELVTESSWDVPKLRALLEEVRIADEIEDHIGILTARARDAISEAAIDPVWRAELCALAVHVAYRDR
jgi:geranylgeranyl diphosphate synthase, type I